MNELNYASLEASRKLSEAGIVLETEIYWTFGGEQGWYLIRNDEPTRFDRIPAPSMAELWQEMPSEIIVEDERLDLKLTKCGGVHYAGYYYFDSDPYVEQQNTNPADALIDLRIWLEGRKG